ncbi:MAG TPA: hypothetical protein VH414_12615 [Lichenihabitans sp.]|nr:hypothetical protein [Lichenihabitans sp.]
MRRFALAIAALALALPCVATAGPVLDRIRRDGILSCGAVGRPGFAAMAGDGPRGRAIDLCKATARAVLGPQGRLSFRLLDVDADFDAARADRVDLLFLTPREVAAQRLTGLTTMGIAYEDRFAVMVPETSAARSLHDLKDATICFMIGAPVWPVLDSAMRLRGTPFRSFGFSEEIEMKDAYDVGRCQAMAGLASELGELRASAGVNHLASRILTEPLGLDPIMILVPAGDAQWRETIRGIQDRRAPG